MSVFPQYENDHMESLIKENEQLKKALKHALIVVYSTYDSKEAFLEHWLREYDLVYKE